jgi:hypothetical protein
VVDIGLGVQLHRIHERIERHDELESQRHSMTQVEVKERKVWMVLVWR